ncbi:glycoside hydrolase family 88/105 protein [Proteiniphilum propionicum]|uniref:glycoside hydrolase family 88/105 protein n=1 Tax=Proteiniphilum propionicum TaxID=2829812 RepID=UPI001EEB9AC0|nr:glycoside hydrolase family 88 protein [Proteiniphilum propionicum]
MSMRSIQYNLFLSKWFMLFLLLFLSCGTDDPIPSDDDDDDNGGEQVIIMPAVENLEITSTENPNELQVSWIYPEEATSVELSYHPEGENETNAIRNNVRRSTSNEDSYLIKVPEHGTYVVGAIAIDNYGKRSKEVKGTATPLHEDALLTVFPEGSDPKEIGIRLTERYIRTVDTQNPRVNYPYVCTWLGAFWFSRTIGDEQLYNRLLARYDNIFFMSGSSNLYPAPNHVDNNVFGSVPLEIYKTTGAGRHLELGLHYADTQWKLPPNATQDQRDWHEQGYSWQTRIWIDDMFMITAVQAQAYQVTGDRKYIDRTAREMAMYLDRIQRPNGLFHHTPTVPFFWGRGNGWMAVGMAELLRILPEDNPDRPRIEEAYRLMMRTLLQYQAEDGMWRQLIDDPVSWKETSGTAMFAYAMIVGVKKGWLNKETYGAAARKAWLSLLTYLNDDDNIRDVCEGTNARNDYQYYLDRKRNTGDLHGQAPLLWCANALSSDL